MERVRFAIVTEEGARKAAAARFCTRLNSSTGVFFEPVFVADYDGLTEQLTRGAAQLAWSPPLVAHELRQHGWADALVALKRGLRASYHSALITALGSPFASLEDLHQVRAGWVARHSASGYVVPRWQLRAKAHDLARMFVQESFLGSHERVAAAVAGGQVDVGATHVTVDPISRQLVRAPWPEAIASGLRVLQLVGPIPGDVILAHRDVPELMRERLVAAFLSLGARDSASQDLFDATQFELVPGSHFALLERLSAAARQHG